MGAVAAPTSTGMGSRGAPTGVGPGHEAQPEAIRCRLNGFPQSAGDDPPDRLHAVNGPSSLRLSIQDRCGYRITCIGESRISVGRIPVGWIPIEPVPISWVCIGRGRQRGASNKADTKPGQACADTPPPARSTPAPATIPAWATPPAPRTRGCGFRRKRDSTHRSESSERKREFPHRSSPVTQRGRRPPHVERSFY